MGLKLSIYIVRRSNLRLPIAVSTICQLVLVLFTYNRKLGQHVPITLFVTNLEFSEKVNYLGLILDKKLNFLLGMLMSNRYRT